MIQTVISGVAVVLSIVNLGFIVLVLLRLKVIGEAQSERSAQDELRSLREEISRSEKEIRDEVRNTQATTITTLVTNIGEFSSTLTTQVDGMRATVEKRFQNLQQSIESRLDNIRETVTNQLKSTVDTLVNTVGELGKSQETQLGNVRKTVHDRLEAMQSSSENKSELMHKTVTNQLQTTADTLVNTIGELGKTQDTQLENIRKTVHDRLEAMQTSNEDKLDQMRKTVDEKLQSTLEKRLGESFNQVSKRLEEVQRGLGEMQELATGVGDLKRVLTNVKTRGTWGEVQLGALLEEILTPDQYDSNVRILENSQEQVEFAIRLPGNDDEPNSCVWLPIDSKFPLADYERLVQTSEAADKDEIEKATGTFLATVRNEAKTISEKYISPPKTTDFAVMFLPTEGLYAEVLRSPGEVADLLHRYRIVVAGPTTLAAILSSLRMGFRTLAIEKRSSEVWEILAAVKTEFGKFGDVMDKLKRQLNTASKTIDETGTRTRAMERTLRTVEELPPDEATARLGLADGVAEIHTTDTDELLE